jgi:hypothetical protein
MAVSRLLPIAAVLMMCVSAVPVGAEDATWTTPILLTEQSSIYFDSDLSIGRNNVYVVSWEYDSGPVSLFRSPDGGATWSVKDPLGGGVFRGEPGMCVYSDGVNDTVILAACGSIYRSVDNGDSFSPLSALPLSDGALWWRFMEVYTNGSWFGRAVDQNIYVVGSQAMGVPWDGGRYVVSFCKSTDGGLTWTDPVIICDLDRDTSLPECVCDGEQMFVFYTMAYGDYMDLYVRSSDDWGVSWSEETVLVPRRGSGWVCPHSVQDLGNGRALLTLGDYVSVTDLELGMIPYGRYGYFDYDDSAFTEVGNVSGPDWQVAGGFSGALTDDGELLLAWARSDGHPYNRIWFTSSTDTGLEMNCQRPWITSSPGLHEGVQERYKYVAEAREANLGANEWSFETNASWLSTESTGETSCVLGGVPAQSGKYWVDLTVSDGDSTDHINWTIKVASTSSVPLPPEDDDQSDGGGWLQVDGYGPEIVVGAVACVAAVAVLAVVFVMRRKHRPEQL